MKCYTLLLLGVLLTTGTYHLLRYFISKQNSSPGCFDIMIRYLNLLVKNVNLA